MPPNPNENTHDILSLKRICEGGKLNSSCGVEAMILNASQRSTYVMKSLHVLLEYFRIFKSPLPQT